MKNILIIGAGVIGAVVAYRLAKGGAKVTIVDQAGPAAGASGASFGWLNASFYADEAHHHLRAEGLTAYHRLLADLPEMPVSWESAIWCEAQGAGLVQMRDDLTALGYPVKHLDRAALAQMVPGWVAPDSALHFTSEGVVDGGQLTRRLLQAAQALGARAILGTRVTGLIKTGDRVLGANTDAGQIYADHVIVTAGVGAAALIGLPMKHRPGLLMKTQPLPRTLHHVLVTPDGEIRQDADGRFVMPTAIGHQADESEALTASPSDLADAAHVRLQSHFPGIPMMWTEVIQALRPVPQDGLPVIGAVGPGLYAAVMHSGMTLAAITGEYVAQEILRDDLVNTLGPYRPGRFTLSE